MTAYGLLIFFVERPLLLCLAVMITSAVMASKS